MEMKLSNQIARVNMLKQQLRAGNVLNESILALFEQIPREAFVPSAMQAFAYSDMQLSLGLGQRMMTPLEEGSILQALNLKGHETLLEIGTGSGFLTALLSKLCKKVISIDYYAEFTDAARKILSDHHCENVELQVGDGSEGLYSRAPFDVIVMTGAVAKIDQTLPMQILPGGKLLVITGTDPLMTCRLLSLNYQAQWESTQIFETNIPPLIQKQKSKEFIF